MRTWLCVCRCVCVCMYVCAVCVCVCVCVYVCVYVNMCTRSCVYVGPCVGKYLQKIEWRVQCVLRLTLGTPRFMCALTNRDQSQI